MRKLRVCVLYKQVIEEIGRQIVRGELAPGQALPPEMRLCEMLGVSRTPLRKALRMLAAKGLVEFGHKGGTLIRSRAHWNYLDCQVLSWLLEAGDADQVVDEIYELRHLIEPVAAALAAKNATAADIACLREAYEQMQAVGGDGAKIVGPDVRFHRAIIGASGNRHFASLAPIVGAVLSVNFNLGNGTPRAHRHALHTYKELLDAIAEHDVSAARLTMQKLIENFRRGTREAEATDGAGTQSRVARGSRS